MKGISKLDVNFVRRFKVLRQGVSVSVMRHMVLMNPWGLASASEWRWSAIVLIS